MQPEPARTRRERLFDRAEAKRVPLRAILTIDGVILGTIVAVIVVMKLRETILLVVVAGFLALILNPPVVLLQRRARMRRGYAVAIVTVAGVAVFAGIAFLFGVPLVTALTNFIDKLPSYVQKAEQGKGWIGHELKRLHLQSWLTKNEPKLTQYAQNLSGPVLRFGKATFAAVLDVVIIFMLVILLLLEAPKIRVGLMALLPAQRALRLSKISGEVSRSITGYMLGDFITSVIAGVIVFAVLSILGVPYALLLGLWVALVDFLPMIGGALAGIPTAIIAGLTQGLVAFIVTVVVFVVYQEIENHVLNPIIMSRTVRINPLLVLVAVLIGANLGGLLGGFFGGFVAVLFAIPVAGAIQVIVREVWASTDPASDRGRPRPVVAVHQGGNGQSLEHSAEHAVTTKVASSSPTPNVTAETPAPGGRT
jgi:predicted PurR-regulated permease PerM